MSLHSVWKQAKNISFEFTLHFVFCFDLPKFASFNSWLLKLAPFSQQNSKHGQIPLISITLRSEYYNWDFFQTLCCYLKAERTYLISWISYSSEGLPPPLFSKMASELSAATWPLLISWNVLFRLLENKEKERVFLNLHWDHSYCYLLLLSVFFME